MWYPEFSARTSLVTSRLFDNLTFHKAGVFNNTSRCFIVCRFIISYFIIPCLIIRCSVIRCFIIRSIITQCFIIRCFIIWCFKIPYFNPKSVYLILAGITLHNLLSEFHVLYGTPPFYWGWVSPSKVNLRKHLDWPSNTLLLRIEFVNFCLYVQFQGLFPSDCQISLFCRAWVDDARSSFLDLFYFLILYVNECDRCWGCVT